ncbi:hypothetical protein [Candidatus Uabimicrobium sp. HlEnr_7]|uniref:hypothetical protein n=1 Tax=Candidatus Uabimicrobium helgolandensis TaxID=3095367 RepID=UPI00355747D1
MNKYDFLAITFLVFTVFFLISGFYHQINQRKLQLLCRGKLNNIGSTFFVYRQTANYQPKNLLLWRDNLKKYSADPEFGHCPSQEKDQPSYQLYFPTTQQLSSNNKILFFDSSSLEKHHTTNKNNISWRHLGGANILLPNGAVVYYKKNNFFAK